MNFRFAVVGLVAAVSLAALSLADEQSPNETNSEKNATQARPAAATSAEAAAESTTQSAAESTTQSTAQSTAEANAASMPDEDAVPEVSLEEAAAAAGNIQSDQKLFDPNKAKPAEIEAYNAKVGPDDKIVCRRERGTDATTGSRFGQKVCRTVRDWRNLPR